MSGGDARDFSLPWLRSGLGQQSFDFSVRRQADPVDGHAIGVFGFVNVPALTTHASERDRLQWIQSGVHALEDGLLLACGQSQRLRHGIVVWLTPLLSFDRRS